MTANTITKNDIDTLKRVVSDHYTELVRLMNNDEATFDETTLVKVYYNKNEEGTVPLIGYEIESRFYSTRTQYYPIDFSGDHSKAIDEQNVEGEDLKLFEVYGNHLINYDGMGLTLRTD